MEEVLLKVFIASMKVFIASVKVFIASVKVFEASMKVCIAPVKIFNEIWKTITTKNLINLRKPVTASGRDKMYFRIGK